MYNFHTIKRCFKISIIYVTKANLARKCNLLYQLSEVYIYIYTCELYSKYYSSFFIIFIKSYVISGKFQETLLEHNSLSFNNITNNLINYQLELLFAVVFQV